MDVEVRVIAHAEQRYVTAGDWWLDKVFNRLHIRVSAFRDKRGHEYEQLIAHHEYTEAILCLQAGINPDDVDEFDKEFEAAREHGPWDNRGWFEFRDRLVHPDAEPGDQSDAPYHKQHAIATGFERIMAAELGVVWEQYEAACLALG